MRGCACSTATDQFAEPLPAGAGVAGAGAAGAGAGVASFAGAGAGVAGFAALPVAGAGAGVALPVAGAGVALPVAGAAEPSALPEPVIGSGIGASISAEPEPSGVSGFIEAEPAEPDPDPAEPDPDPASFAALSARAFAADFSAATSCCSLPYESSASAEFRDDRNARTIDVIMKIVPATAVRRFKKPDAPEPPNTVAALPPPNAAPMPPPLPLCKSTVSIKNKHTMTCRTVTRVDIERPSF